MSLNLLSIGLDEKYGLLEFFIVHSKCFKRILFFNFSILIPSTISHIFFKASYFTPSKTKTHQSKNNRKKLNVQPVFKISSKIIKFFRTSQSKFERTFEVYSA